MPAIKAPTLIIQGEDDIVLLDQADANLRGLPAETAAKMKWVAGGHDAELSVDVLMDDLEAWFGRYLMRDGSAGDTSFSVLVPETSLLGEDRGTQRRPWLFSPSRAESPARIRRPVAWRATKHPGSAWWCTGRADQPWDWRCSAAGPRACGYALGVLPGQSAVFTSEPLTAPLTSDRQ